MPFDSYGFGLLFACTLVAFLACRGQARQHVLLAASYLFYAGWELRFVPLLVFSTLLDYGVGLALERTSSPARRRLWLGLSLLGNLGVLVYFKYLRWLLSSFGLGGPGEAGFGETQAFHVAGNIPPGLSFYTFQTLSYAIDVYRGAPAERRLDRFALYVSFFPQLVAGPIVRAHQFLPQLDRREEVHPREVVQGVELFLVGLFKKVVIANQLGQWVDPVFARPEAHAGHALALAGWLFWVQIYCDFSAYSTMARGLARMLGYDLPQNFRYPLLAGDPLTYRRGWHRTMGDWFRDYVFHPLGGTRRGRLRTALNLMVVWSLFGLWHGAGWTFLAWGLFSGLVQVIYRELQARRWLPGEFPGKRAVGVAFNALLLLPSLVLFRSESWAKGWEGLTRVFTLTPEGSFLPASAGLALLVLLAAHVLSYRYYRHEDVLNRVGWPARLLLVGAMTLVIAVAAAPGRPFLYFQF